MSKELCRAEIRPKLKPVSIIIMVIPAVFLLLWVIPLFKEEGHYSSAFLKEAEYVPGHSFNLFFIETSFSYSDFLTGILIASGVLLIAVVFFVSLLVMSKNCVLILNENGISGEKKSLFGKKCVGLPFENITSIAVQNGLIDKLIDGQTVSIASATGFIRFRSVMNAQEFTDKTLAELRNFKEMTNV